VGVVLVRVVAARDLQGCRSHLSVSCADVLRPGVHLNPSLGRSAIVHVTCNFAAQGGLNRHTCTE
jgi:hypothetical protein